MSAKPPKRWDWSILLAYAAAVLVMSSVLGTYFFSYVPNRKQYFLNMRFRTLAVVGGQIKGRLESLSRALSYVETRSIEAISIPKYYSALLPEFRIVPEPAGKPNGTNGAGTNKVDPSPSVVQFKVRGLQRAEYPWAAVLQDSILTLEKESQFRDVLLAKASGEVVYQQHQETPRIASLTSLVQARASPQGAGNGGSSGEHGLIQGALSLFKGKSQPPEVPRETGARLPEHATLIFATLDASVVTILLQPVQIDGEGRLPGMAQLYVAGIVDERTLTREAMYISPERVLWMFLPLLVVFLLFPVLKLWTVKPKERYSFSDVVLSAGGVLGLSVVAVLCMFHPTPANPRTDTNLQELADLLERNMTREFESSLKWLEALEGARAQLEPHLRPCLAGVKSFPLNPRTKVGTGEYTTVGCDLWEAIGELSDKAVSASLSPGAMDVDVVFWSDENGGQVRKWTTKNQLTGPVNGANHEYFRELRARRLWHIPGLQHGFVVHPLDSPTTAEMAVILTVAARERNAGAPPIVALSMNVRPQALVDVLMPPEYGFAVVDEDGAVLFHSTRERSLRENFFEETGSPRELKAVSQRSATQIVTADYRGKEHRILMRPLSIKGSPWRIVVFRELDPILRFAMNQQWNAFLLLLVYWLLLAAYLCGAWIRWRSAPGGAANGLMQYIWADEARHRAYILSTLLLGGLILVALLAGQVMKTRLRYEWMDYVLVASFSLPFAAFGLARVMRKLVEERFWQEQVMRRSPMNPRSPDDWLRSILGRVAILLNTLGKYLQDRIPYRRQLAVLYFELVLLTGVIPAIGALWVSYRLGDAVRTQDWLGQIAKSFGERQTRMIAAREQARHYSEQTKEILRSPASFADMGTALPEEQAEAPLYDYLRPLREGRVVPAEQIACAIAEAERPAARAGALGLRRFENSYAARLLRAIRTLTPMAAQRDQYVKSRFGRWVNRQPIDEPTSEFHWMGAGSRDEMLLVWEELDRAETSGRTSRWRQLAAVVEAQQVPMMEPRWQAISILFMIVVLALVYFLVRQVFLKELADTGVQALLRTGRDLPTIGELVENGRNNILMIGLPRSGKDKIVQGTIGGKLGVAPYRIRLLDATLNDHWVERTLEDVRYWIDGISSALQPNSAIWVHISNLESGLSDQESRRALLHLLERVTEASLRRDLRVRIVATSSVDPVLHCAEVFPQELGDVYRDALPEVELKRWALILSKFDRCYVQRPGETGCAKPQAHAWEATILEECTGHRELLNVGRELIEEMKTSAQRMRTVSHMRNGDLPRRLVYRRVLERAEAFYQVIWASSSRSEKLLLVQLAQTGVVNPQCTTTLLELVRKGLVRLTPAPRIFNRTFVEFLKNVESREVVAIWESEAGEGVWHHVGRLCFLLLVMGALFWVVTQGVSLETLLPLLTTSGLVTLPKLGQWISQVASRSPGDSMMVERT